MTDDDAKAFGLSDSKDKIPRAESERLQRSGFGEEYQELHFAHVEFEIVMRPPNEDVEKAVG